MSAHFGFCFLEIVCLCWTAGGDKSTGQSTVPTGLSGIVQLAAGARHTCALYSSGAVACWGGFWLVLWHVAYCGLACGACAHACRPWLLACKPGDPLRQLDCY